MAMGDITHSAFLAAVRDSNVDVVRRYLTQPTVRVDVGTMDEHDRAGGGHRLALWFEDPATDAFVFSTIARNDDVALFRWFFSQAFLESALCALATRITRAIVNESSVSPAAREMLEIVLTSPVFTMRMNDAERRNTLAITTNMAAASGSNALLELLLAYGADATQSYDMPTPLCMATAHGDVQTIECLVAHGADVFEPSLVTQASYDSNEVVLKELLRLGAGPRSLTSEHRSALHLAVELRVEEVIQLLLCDGMFDVDVRDDRGRTPLMALAMDERRRMMDNESVPIAAGLHAYGADLEARDANGATALHFVVLNEFGIDVSLIRALLVRGCDLNARNDRGCTPLRELATHALDDTDTRVLDVLLQCGADPFIPCNEGISTKDVLERTVAGQDYVRQRRPFFRRC